MIEDREVAESTMGNTHLWLHGPADRDNGGREPMPFFPAPGQSVFRVVRLPPPGTAMTAGELAAAADAFFFAVGDAWCRSDTTRDPFMHRTPTTDYVTILSGQVSLLLEAGEGVALRPFDTVVQRQTNHAWQVEGIEPAVLLVVMIGDPHRRPDR